MTSSLIGRRSTDPSLLGKRISSPSLLGKRTASIKQPAVTHRQSIKVLNSFKFVSKGLQLPLLANYLLKPSKGKGETTQQKRKPRSCFQIHFIYHIIAYTDQNRIEYELLFYNNINIKTTQ